MVRICGLSVGARMENTNPDNIGVDLHSLVESHARPFMVIDRNYRIMAVNAAYEHAYGTTAESTIGDTCYQVTHGQDKPCDLMGEDCPHKHMFESAHSHCCLHVHYDQDNHVHQVRVTAFPLQSPDGTMYMGELIEEVSSHAECCDAEDRMVGESKAFHACVEQLNMAAASDSSVLLQGETGTGKELAAKYIHEHSARKNAPFMVVDCSALTGAPFEAEVFGQADDTFNNGTGESAGLFSRADAGTLFLDNIGELNCSLQAKLLRVLETGQYRQVGGRKQLQSNARIVCASNRHLWEAVLAGHFREDLYYRVACLNIQIPKLSERLEDIPLLSEKLLECASRNLQHDYSLTPEGVQRLTNYHYPGNIRELRNILEVAITRTSSDVIDNDTIQKAIFQVSRAREHSHTGLHETVSPPLRTPLTGTAIGDAGHGENTSLSDVEAQHINVLLHRYDGNRREVASALGISERTLYRKLKRYRLS